MPSYEWKADHGAYLLHNGHKRLHCSQGRFPIFTLTIAAAVTFVTVLAKNDIADITRPLLKRTVATVVTTFALPKPSTFS